MGLTIRDAQPDDAQSLTRLVRQLGYRTNLGAEDEGNGEVVVPGRLLVDLSSAETMIGRLERLRSSESDRVVVAEMDGEVVGLASVHISLSVELDEPAAKLSAIVVDEKHRRRGIGQALVSAMEAEARARGCCVMFLTTAERREDARAFYRGLGFDETGRRFAKWLR